MLPKEQLDRINELARKQRSEGLTVPEQAEQDALRRAYLESFRKSFKAQLEAQGFRPTEAKHGCNCGDANCKHHHHHGHHH